jgi:hypothetical protein
LDRDGLTNEWRVAHRAAVRHLIAASWSECGCTAQALCADGQVLEDRAEDAERRMGLPPKLAGWALDDEYREGIAS